MGKSEKLVVLSVLLVVVLLFVWSLQGDTSSEKPASQVYAADRGSVAEPPMTTRVAKGSAQAGRETGSRPSNLRPSNLRPSNLRLSGTTLGGDRDSTPLSDEVLSDEVSVSEAPGAPRSNSNGMLLAETDGSGTVEITSSGSSRRGTSSIADPAVRTDELDGATSRSGVSRARVRMQHGWDLITTSGLQGTVDPSMFLYDVSAQDVTWEALAKDLYGDEAKAGLLRHNNEGMDEPKGSVFVPAKDDLGREASVRTVEVLQGESLWQVAKRTLGKGTEWKAVYEANRDVIADPDFVAPGTILKIPVQ
ncbi:LysM domain/BON superfamily protein [Planctomycetes bacterium Poly30]|uniref:LysM domain/BON superfamily protein n=1 Tax=Saltatorellus ferox TaxID=2528018 RepID=A0A518EUN4_9BACT|nr:LysM domain/BON superfamily protein [Planctomycetes bacterium Poly30]